jgi:endonuclease-3 related protein
MDTPKESLSGLYKLLLSRYGLQGWWPIASKAGEEGFDVRGYHRGDYAHPKSDSEKFEVIAGAILAQSTSWTNVEKALINLKKKNLLSLEKIRKTPRSKLSPLIKSSLYHNVKARKLAAFADFVHDEFNEDVEKLLSLPTEELRPRLLSVWGVGPETADSIILYAAHKPSFVVDAYTKRIFTRLGFLTGNEPYDEIKKLFEKNLLQSPLLYNEYHALIVEHAKQHCRKNPACSKCPLIRMCPSAR